MKSPSAAEARAMDVKVTTETLEVALTDGRRVSAPLEWFPRLRDASEKQRSNWRLIGPGIGIHWDEIDEDICLRAIPVRFAVFSLGNSAIAASSS